MTVVLDSLYLAHVFYYTTVFYLRSRFAPYIPSAKAGGFTALFCKGYLHGRIVDQVIFKMHNKF